MKQTLNSVLKEALEKVSPSKDELDFIDSSLAKFLKLLDKAIKASKISVEVFVGGSAAKKTLVRKRVYDIDIFMRFAQTYKDEDLSNLTEKILAKFKPTKVHGSRDYFQIKVNETLYFELVPVRKITKQEEAKNITDLSYSHVKYINKKIKSAKLLDDIKLAKAFAHANNCYGAESYIKGFSGYSLELLVYYYKSFQNFLRAMTKLKDEKLIIDIEKLYKNKREILMDLNTSKLAAPIILIDPTYRQRNALAALSSETLSKFAKLCAEFLKSPSLKYFEPQITDITKIKEKAQKNKNEFILLEAQTEKQEGDIAGTKLLKFYNHLSDELSKFYKLKDSGFNYNHKQKARYFFVAKNIGEILFDGPSIKDKKNAELFQKKHKQTFTKSGKLYAKRKLNFSLREFVNSWTKKNKQKINEMSISDLRIIDY